ncbi:patatin-like phospholipase family protein [Hanstruepera marina]|uniref:patatin-like phospholipase family protein n=1 Tax=Hanstruepera marina TaxID=2873265 RepID=UPI001CA708D9|nr:patatin-like phospholipase family protein [Hanstruepera marina]
MKRLILGILFVFSCFGFSQEDLKGDPKVGLVLSGGGAKGLAHIGALKVIDSLGIRVDYVAGTSMGAIVGALYASGYSGNEIDSIFKDVDFDKIINDNLPRASKTFYERDNSEKYAVSLPFDKFKLALPSGLSRGQNTLSLLSKLLLHVSNVDDFSELPIPFFCIATNVETGAPVILDSGSLPQAIAASGAFPSLFQPVIIDDQILIDGGVVNNYPIDELKAKGLDIIVGVDVQDDLATREELKSAPDILLQINNYRTINDMKVKSKKTDIYIKPDIRDYTVVSFSEGRSIIEQGFVAAQKKQDALEKIAEMQVEKPTERKRIQPINRVKISTIIVEGNELYTRSYVLGKIKIKSDEEIDYIDFVRGVNNLAATNNFESVIYDLKPSRIDDEYDLYIKVKETPIRTFLKLGIHYDDLYKSAALVNLTRKKILFKNDVASLDFIVGDHIRYDFNYFIDKGFYWSIGIYSRYNHFEKNIPSATILTEQQRSDFNVNKIDVGLSDFTNQFYVQTLFRKDFALTLGGEYKRLRISTETFIEDSESEETVFENSDFVSVFGKLKLDTYDNKYFPNEGFLFDGDFHLYLYSSDFNNTFSEFSIAKATIGYSLSFWSKFSANITAQGGFKIGEDSTQSLNFVLGGYGDNLINNFTPFFGYDYISLPGNSFVKGMLTLDYEVFKKNHIIFNANYANVEDNIFETGEWITTPDFSGYAIGYSLETFLGPIEGKYSWSPEANKGYWFFNVGFWF